MRWHSVHRSNGAIAVTGKLEPSHPVMIDSYRAGVPGNGKRFPDGSQIVKITWNLKQNEEAPFLVSVPDTLAAIGCMVKDSGRFSDAGGWGYASSTMT